MTGRRSSIIPWIRMAIEQVKKSREEDIFSELLELGESYGVSSFVSDVPKSLQRNKAANFIWLNKSTDSDRCYSSIHNCDSLFFSNP